MEQSPSRYVFARRILLASDISIQSRPVTGLNSKAELNGSDVRDAIKPQREPNSGNHQVRAAGDSPSPTVSCCCGPTLVEVPKLPRYKQPYATAKCCCLTRDCAENQADRLNNCLNDSTPSQAGKISTSGRKPLDPSCSCSLEVCLVDFEVLPCDGSPSSEFETSMGSVVDSSNSTIMNAGLDFCGCGGSRVSQIY
jgi:hypothetical protein